MTRKKKDDAAASDGVQRLKFLTCIHLPAVVEHLPDLEHPGNTLPVTHEPEQTYMPNQIVEVGPDSALLVYADGERAVILPDEEPDEEE